MKFILASKSPRRREILSELGLEFEIITADTDESCDLTDPRAFVEELALRKGLAVADKLGEDEIIIASDTVVACGGEILGKPTDRADAERMLNLLSGSRHQVISGIALISKPKQAVASEVTQVIFDSLTSSDKEIYLSSSEPYDKAGAYAIQGIGRRLVESYDGEFDAIVGLGLKLTEKLIKQATKNE